MLFLVFEDLLEYEGGRDVAFLGGELDDLAVHLDRFHLGLEGVVLEEFLEVVAHDDGGGLCEWSGTTGTRDVRRSSRRASFPRWPSSSNWSATATALTPET